MSAVTLDDMKTEYLLVGKDGNIWGVFETEEQAESVRGNQADPEWYRIEKQQTQFNQKKEQEDIK